MSEYNQYITKEGNTQSTKTSHQNVIAKSYHTHQSHAAKELYLGHQEML
jgi:hypothetical protein